jgi:hypothetical protein
MTPKDQYTKRIENFRLKTGQLQKLENRLSLLRLITFISGIILFFGLISLTITGAIVSLIIFLIIFAWLVKRHAVTEHQRQFYGHLETINQLEYNCLEGSYFKYEAGSAYIDRDHPNSYDLDLFGHASVYQYINRTTSKPAADMLASWLKTPAGMKEIYLRQDAVAELNPLIDWRQKLLTLGYANNHAGMDPGELLNWTTGENYFPGRKYLKTITILLSTLGIVATALVISGMPPVILLPVLIINFMFYFSQGKKISRLHAQVSKYSDMLTMYASTIELIEKEQFGSEKLQNLHQVFAGIIPASVKIKKLAKQVSRLDARLNVMVSIPLNLFFFWDIHCCLALEKWKTTHSDEIVQWLKAMAEFEVLACFANMAHNNPEWVMPRIIPGYFEFKAKNAGHPLIPKERRINNSLEIDKSGKIILVTGSNMSGKSTFLRTCGVNTVLALCGSPVCADSFTISHVDVFSSMRISDSLEDNTSSFYAELKKLAAIIKEAEHNQRVFLLLDEILRGTNSNDRYTGSVALIRQLIDYGTVGIVATHDLKLADLADELKGKIDNYHFDVKIEGEELYFDYKLNPGICTSLNASILMKKMGIRI